MFGSLLASNFCGFGEARQRWPVQLKPDPLGCGNAMRCLILLAAVTSLLGCDPGSFKRFPIDESSPTPPIEQVLREFDAERLSGGFVRADVSPEVARAYLNCECRVLRWYDRDAVIALERGSFFYLAVFVDPTERLAIATGAFPSFGEPGDLKELRLALSRHLTESGFLVHDTELR